MTMTTPAHAAAEVLGLAQHGRFDEIAARFAPQLRALVSADALRAGWTAELGRLGQLVSVGEPAAEPAGPGISAVRVPVGCEHGALTVIVSVTDDGWLTGLQLAPAGAAEPLAPWQPPDYAHPEAFDEQELTVGSGPLAVPGTLTVPRRQGPLAAVVLLAGSGPLDRDETIGRNKPFKDLAWGLASRGVAVLRFDKVTFAHREQVRLAAGFTVADEYLADATAAVALLGQRQDVDRARVFLLGHSLGGTVAPRIAAAEPAIAGLVILAGGAQPLHWSEVRQIRYLASLDPATAAAAEPVIEAITRQARLVDSPDLTPSTPAADLPLGTPAPYWLDLRGYDPVAVAAALGRPMLLLQGGRDYQVTVADDLELWRTGLDRRAGVTIRVYEACNHLFFAGTGPSTPADYEPAQHMDGAVVADIAGWLTSVSPGSAGS